MREIVAPGPWVYTRPPTLQATDLPGTPLPAAVQPGHRDPLAVIARVLPSASAPENRANARAAAQAGDGRDDAGKGMLRALAQDALNRIGVAFALVHVVLVFGAAWLAVRPTRA